MHDRLSRRSADNLPPASKAKYLGKLCLINTLAGLEAFTLRLWTGVLGLTSEQVQTDLAQLRKDFANPRIHTYWPLYDFTSFICNTNVADMSEQVPCIRTETEECLILIHSERCGVWKLWVLGRRTLRIGITISAQYRNKR